MKSYKLIPSIFLMLSLGACQSGINQSPEDLGTQPEASLMMKSTPGIF